MPKSRARPFTKADEDAWQFWREYISDNGGYLTSQPEIHTLTFECLHDSILPELLESAGLGLSNIGVGERLLPSTAIEIRGSKTFTTQAIVPTQVSVWSFKLQIKDEGPVRARD